MLAGASPQALAQGFDAQVAPPRFLLKATPGDRVREVIQITNAGREVGRYVARTADWALSENGEVRFIEGDPAPESCRPWARIERREFSVNPQVARAFRFEVHVPEDAKAGECRFAIMIGGDPKSTKPVQIGQLAVPVTGQIAVVVYLAVGGAKPALEFMGLRPGKLNALTVPVAVIRNNGNAHGRPDGVLRAKDASGAELEMSVSSVPILPGQTREVAIVPVSQDGRPTQPKFPLALRGTIEWDGGKINVDQTVK